MVLNGPTDEAIEKLHKDFLFWTNIIEEIENRQIALRVEFVIEIKTPPIIFTDTHAEITSALPE
uniref:Uncharacterized protein n=1 Tax=Romanomermis culicivorax TaxID=13658 RepID=A0A915K2F0_ROMCU